MTRPATLLGWTAPGVQAPAGKRANGYRAGERPPNQWLNYDFRIPSDWIDFLDELYTGDGAEYFTQERFLVPSTRWYESAGGNWNFDVNGNWSIVATQSGTLQIPLDYLLNAGEKIVAYGIYFKNLSVDTPTLTLSKRVKSSGTASSLTSINGTTTGWNTTPVFGGAPGGQTVVDTENYYLNVGEISAANLMVVTGARISVLKRLA